MQCNSKNVLTADAAEHVTATGYYWTRTKTRDNQPHLTQSLIKHSSTPPNWANATAVFRDGTPAKPVYSTQLLANCPSAPEMKFLH